MRRERLQRTISLEGVEDELGLGRQFGVGGEGSVDSERSLRVCGLVWFGGEGIVGEEDVGRGVVVDGRGEGVGGGGGLGVEEDCFGVGERVEKWEIHGDDWSGREGAGRDGVEIG